MKRGKKHPVQKPATSPPSEPRLETSFFPRRHGFWLGLFLVVVAVLAYQSVWPARFIWDDDFYVTNNATLHSVHGLKQIWFDTAATPQYYPLVYTTFWLEYHIWQLNPLGYHIVNVLLHSVGAILLWRVLARLEFAGAWLGAAIFALHPVNVESVAWITERKNVLSAVFFFASVLAYLRFDGRVGIRRWWWWLGALLLFTGALWSKTVACSLPAALLLVNWWKKGRLQKNDVLPLVPFFMVGLWLGLQTAWLEKHHVGASGMDWSLSFAQRCLVAGRALWFYAGKLVWPEKLTFSYPRWQVETGAWWQWLFPIAAIGVVAALWLARKRIGRGPLVAVLFFAGTLFPALGFFALYPMRYSFVADHFQYLAGIGLIVLFAGGVTILAKRSEARLPWLVPSVCAVLLLVLGTLTWRQSRMYADLETVWRTTIERNPTSWLAQNNLGGALLEQNRTDEAMIHFRQAIEIWPDYPEAHNNLGNALVRQGQIDEGIAEYERSQSLAPDLVDADNNLGLAFLQRGQVDEALTNFQQALTLRPELAETHFNLANALMQKGQSDEAIGQFEKALALQPGYAQAHINLGSALFQAGRVDEAIAHFREALVVRPDIMEAHFDLGNILFQKGEVDEAIIQFQQALALRPDNAQVNNNLALALLQKREVDGAITYLQKSLAVEPDYVEGRNNLGFALAQKGRDAEAIVQFENALALQPGFTKAQGGLARIAWRMATSTNDSIRNGAKAVELGKELSQLSGGTDPQIEVILAAAYAEAGQFSEAITIARRALELATTRKNSPLADALQQQIKFYEAGRPLRDAGATH